MNKLTRKPVAENCTNCKRIKICRMYILQDGETFFVCHNCQHGLTRLRTSRMNKSDHKQRMLIEEYNEARNKALLEGPSALLQFMRERKLPIPSSTLSLELTYHKTITGITSLPLEFRKKSKQWLDARGSSSWDDGDLK